MHDHVQRYSGAGVNRRIVPLAAATPFASIAARADEGDVSFWVPGQFSSLAAVPGEPGFQTPVIHGPGHPAQLEEPDTDG
jgi:hypothetical protein